MAPAVMHITIERQFAGRVLGRFSINRDMPVSEGAKRPDQTSTAVLKSGESIGKDERFSTNRQPGTGVASVSITWRGCCWDWRLATRLAIRRKV